MISGSPKSWWSSLLYLILGIAVKWHLFISSFLPSVLASFAPLVSVKG
jgi:hypothetical protein